VHFDSARMEVGVQVASSPNASTYLEMAFNLVKNLRETKLHKVNVRFFLKGNSFDNLIGRSAHMMYLENTCFMNTIKYKYWNELFA
jgi:hypothetical protein